MDENNDEKKLNTPIPSIDSDSSSIGKNVQAEKLAASLNSLTFKAKLSDNKGVSDKKKMLPTTPSNTIEVSAMDSGTSKGFKPDQKPAFRKVTKHK